ncbi:hypothetical protein HDR69_04395 [bacterium]|nr:hypothetical protein [Bacteroides sp.]MBD5339033.1 hypothetical protein [Bacteroides sp.]MBD5385646.1 hypothetical protein [bacterium]
MDTIETIIPDDKGNYLVVVLNFYDDIDKAEVFQIPEELANFEIADINIQKKQLDQPLAPKAFFRMCDWLISQFCLYPKAVFSFICSISELGVRGSRWRPEEYRWNLFEVLFRRKQPELDSRNIRFLDIIVGPEGYQTYGKIFFRDRHYAVVNLVESHLVNKYV